MIAIVSVLLVLTASMIVIRVAAVALVHTGIGSPARQALYPIWYTPGGLILDRNEWSVSGKRWTVSGSGNR